MKSNAKYWQKRFSAVEKQMNLQGKSAVDKVAPAFDQAEKQIQKEIESWYQRFADNNEISLVEAKKLLSGKDLDELKWDVATYIKYGSNIDVDPTWMKELENASAKFHISRLEALKIRTQQAAEVAFAKEKNTLLDAAHDSFTEDYYHTAFEIQEGLGIGWNIGQVDQSKLEKIIQKPWTVDGTTFSDKIWLQKNKLVDSLHTELTQMCILGKAPDDTIKKISKQMGVSKSQAGRLIMTESAYFASEGQKQCFKDLDVEQYEIVATLDSHTSEICQEMDGKVFKMSEFEAGVTAPPFHPWCRSCTAPYFEDFNEGATRAARSAEDGKTYQVPADLKYADWKSKFVDGNTPIEYKKVDPFVLLDKGEDQTQQVVDNADEVVSPAFFNSEAVIPETVTEANLLGTAAQEAAEEVVEEVKLPKKEYLTKKKLQEKITEGEAQINDLKTQFQKKVGETIDDMTAEAKVVNADVDEYIEKIMVQDGSGSDNIQMALDLKHQSDDLQKQIDEWQEKLDQKIQKEQKKELKSQIKDLEEKKILAEEKLQKLKDQEKTYSGIWKNDIKTSDYSMKKDSIQAKKDYFNDKINSGSLDQDTFDQYQEYLKELDEFDLEGKTFEEAETELKKINSDLNKFQKDLDNIGKKKPEVIGSGQFDADAYTQERKDNALWAKQTKTADNKLRDKCGEVWQNAPKEQRDAAYDYTNSYHKFNEPLRGIEYGTNKFLGVGNVDLDEIGVHYSGFRKGQMRKEINDLTDIIDKSSYDFDMWLNRGCDYSGMDKFFNCDMNLLRYGSQDDLEKALLGTTPTEFGFGSMGCAKGKGFNRSITLNIYAPSGTKMLYCEPFSAFGHGSGRMWDGVSTQSSFGQESEVLLQQGTKFRITKVERSHGQLYFDLEVIEQNPVR